MKRFSSVLALGTFMFFCATLWADVPRLINFQGVLRDGSGNPVANGSYSITFRIYDAPTGGTLLWDEDQSVTTSGGLFTVLLGAADPIPDSVFADTVRWLGIQISPDAFEMTPRQRLVSVGYSFAFAGFNIQDSNIILADRLGGSVGIGTDDPQEKLDVAGNIKSSDTVFATAFSSTSPLKLQTNKTTRIYVDDVTGNVGIGTTTPDPFRLLINTPSGQNDVLGLRSGSDFGRNLFFQYDDPNNVFKFTSEATNGFTFMPGIVEGNGNVGIGTESPVEKLDIAGNAALRGLYPYVSLTASPWPSVAHMQAGVNLAGSASGDYLMFHIPDTKGFTFHQGTTNRVTVDPSGNVGIGTTSPAARLSIAGVSLASQTALRIDGSSSSTSFTPDFLSVEMRNTDATANNNSHLGFVNSNGFESGGMAGIHVVHGDNTTSQGALALLTRPVGSVVVERMRIDPAGNVGIGTTSPGASNLLELSSTTKGFVLPRMTKAQRDAISSPVSGMMIFQTDNTPGLRVYNGTNWMRFTETAD